MDNLRVIKPKPNQYMIDWLEDLLEHAKSGDLQSMAIACLHADGAVSNGWTGIRCNKDCYTLIGQFDKVKAVLLEPIVNQEKAEDD